MDRATFAFKWSLNDVSMTLLHHETCPPEIYCVLLSSKYDSNRLVGNLEVQDLAERDKAVEVIHR